MLWEKANKKEDNSVLIPRTWLFLHYYEALTVLFRIENALRVFIYIILKEKLQDKWHDIQIASEDREPEMIKAIAARRIDQAKNFGYLGYNISCPIMHLTTGELMGLMTSEKCWPYFKDYFLGSKDIIKNKFYEIINVRNSLSHFRPIKDDDIDLIKQNSKHVLTLIEKCIYEVSTCSSIVPSNTTEKWYEGLKALVSENCELKFSQSKDEKWICVDIIFNCPIIRKRLRPRMASYSVLTILSSNILTMFPVLKSNIIYLSEFVPSYLTMTKDYDAPFRKKISFIFSRITLNERHEDIKDAIKNLLLLITKETELIKQDNLARGKIIDTASVRASYRISGETKEWVFGIDNLLCNIKENDHPEYWGNSDVFFDPDFITSTTKYPWASTTVSEETTPF